MPYNSNAAALQMKHTRTMHQPRNLHTAIRSILNSIQSMLSTTPIGLRLTTSWAQAMSSYLTTQQVLPPPPSKLTLRSLQITLISLWFPAQHRDTPRINTPFSIQLNKFLGMLHRTFAEVVLLSGFSCRSGFLICEKIEFQMQI